MRLWAIRCDKAFRKRVNLSAPAAYDVCRPARAKMPARLTWIKAQSVLAGFFQGIPQQGMCLMPTDTLLLSIVICCVFALFATVLAWLDHSTIASLRAKAAEKASSRGAQASQRAA